MKNNTKQVQVRLPQELHNNLKGSLALDGRTLVDFFSEAAKAYITNKEQYTKSISDIMEGKENG